MVHRVVIVGAGFAGLNTARALRSADVDITIVDRRNFHLFQPLLYQVATAGLSAPAIAAPIPVPPPVTSTHFPENLTRTSRVPVGSSDCGRSGDCPPSEASGIMREGGRSRELVAESDRRAPPRAAA